METSLSPWRRTAWDYTLCFWELCRFEIGEFRERLHAQSAQVKSCFQDTWNLGLVRLRTWPASASNMQKTAGWRHRIASLSELGLDSSIPMHPGRVTQSSGSEISVSCETVATHESTLQMSSWSHSNLVCNLWILLAWLVSTPVFIANRR